MAMNNISTAARNGMCNTLVDLIDVGTTDANGDFTIWDAGFAVELAKCEFANPAFGASGASNIGEAIAGTIANDTSAAGGASPAAVCRIRDRNNSTVFEGTVGTSGADLNLNTLTITASDIVSITAMTVTMPAA
jgi:hypothetical protein